MPNYPNITDVSTVLNAVMGQAIGAAQAAALSTADFTVQAETTLKAGYDRVIEAISQVLSKTIFSFRPYTRHFNGLEADAIRYGNHVRKLQRINNGTDFETDQWLPLTDGQSVDMYTIKKPEVIQTNFYDQFTYQNHVTIFRNQLNVAFSSPEEFARFIAMIMGDITNDLEQASESMARLSLGNFMGAKCYADSGNIIHLVTEYKTYAGISDASWNVYDPTNYINFIKWMCGRIKTLSGYLTERTALYHKNITNARILRHTPYPNQKVYILTSVENNISSSVLSDIYHDEKLKLTDHELINFWQNPTAPETLSVIPSYIDSDGVAQKTDSAVTANTIIGLIFDEEAAGYTIIDEYMGATPFNQAGEYYNIYYKRNYRWWNDMTENALILSMD